MVSAAPGGARWYHQHFGASKEPFRLTAWFGPHNPGREPGPPGEKHTDYTAMDIPEGGTAIPYYMEDPFLRQEYAERMKREGAENRMRAGILRARLSRAVAEGMMPMPLSPSWRACTRHPRLSSETHDWIARPRPGMTDEMTDEEAQGGRIFFSNTGRTFGEEDELCVLSVGVDIGSSTSHLVFSRIVLERLDSRYVVTQRESFYQSDILLTPYAAEDEIDADALGAFIEQPIQGRQGRSRRDRHRRADPDRRRGAAAAMRARIGELFARQAGKMVAVSAGDSLETVMAAYGSGAVARSIRERRAGDECRCRRRHVEDRGLRRRQGDRRHRARCRRAARRARRRAPHRAARGGRPPLRRRAWA